MVTFGMFHERMLTLGDLRRETRTAWNVDDLWETNVSTTEPTMLSPNRFKLILLVRSMRSTSSAILLCVRRRRGGTIIGALWPII